MKEANLQFQILLSNWWNIPLSLQIVVFLGFTAILWKRKKLVGRLKADKKYYLFHINFKYLKFNIKQQSVHLLQTIIDLKSMLILPQFPRISQVYIHLYF